MTIWSITDGPERVAVSGDLRLANAAPIRRALLAHAARAARATRLDLDLGGARVVDGAVMALLVDLRARLIARGVASDIVGTPPHLRPIVHLYRGDEPPVSVSSRARAGAIVRLGDAVASWLARARGGIAFAGELAQAVAGTLRHPACAGWGSLASLVERTGTDGIAIVVVLDFLVGFVMAFQSTRQLQTYGANLYVADIVGIAMTRELAPLITAIIIAGRSGAAFAAELGTMRVSEEIDALRTMGIPPVPYLVLPRIVALVIVAPVLALLGDVAGTLGGLAVGATTLDVTPRAYLAELHTVLVASDVWTGLVKAAAFGGAIATIGCQQGLTARGAASGVGRSTTTTVVYCLFTIVAIDTALTMLFRSLDL